MCSPTSGFRGPDVPAWRKRRSYDLFCWAWGYHLSWCFSGHFFCALLATHDRHLVNPVIIGLFTKSDQQPNHIPIITQHKRQAAMSTEMGSNTKVVRLVICFISKSEHVLAYGFFKTRMLKNLYSWNIFYIDWTRSGRKYHPNHSATQPLWVTEWLPQALWTRAAEWLSGWCRVAEAAIQPISHSEWLSGWVAEWLPHLSGTANPVDWSARFTTQT